MIEEDGEMYIMLFKEKLRGKMWLNSWITPQKTEKQSWISSNTSSHTRDLTSTSVHLSLFDSSIVVFKNGQPAML